MSQIKTSDSVINREKKKVAVFFGGRSPEHDVSIITGLQVLNALDQELFESFPVYVAPNGSWYVGDILRKRESFLLNEAALKNVTEVILDLKADRGGVLIPKKPSFWRRGKSISFDVAIPAFHGPFSEDGSIQGLFELANVPYTGMRTKACAILMDKVTSKYFLQALGIDVLPFGIIKRPEQSYSALERDLEKIVKPIGFPCIIKPAHLGSSIGVAKVNDIDELLACLPAVFEYDDVAIVEPFVENLVEYNISVLRVLGKVITSAIERPKSSDELLDFKQKYMSGGDDKSGNKLSASKADVISSNNISEGMLSLTRDINPDDIPEDMEDKIKKWAKVIFNAIDGSGAPRIDFIANSKTNEIWMNEINPCPGSFGFFLWEALEQDPIFFTDLLSHLIDEANAENNARILPLDPVPIDARLLKRG